MHRWYEPGTGRYSSSDPSEEARLEEPNQYLYALARPVLFIDPLGLKACECSDDCPGGVWGYVGVGAFASIGFKGGSKGVGVFQCDSNPRKVLAASTKCKITGAIVGFGAGVDGTFGLGRACACKKSDLTNTSTGMVAIFGPGGLTGQDCATRQYQDGHAKPGLVFGLGPSRGAGIGRFECKVRPLFAGWSGSW